MKKKILVVDIGGSNVKLMISREEKRKFESGPELTPKSMLTQMEAALEGWEFDAVSIGFPSVVRDGEIMKEPNNLPARG